jgi:hypothetical protein
MDRQETLVHSIGGTDVRSHRASILAGMMNLIVPWLRSVDDWLGRHSEPLGQSRAQLTRLAESYEASQPSYAADLRAAASMTELDGVRLR